MRSDGWNNLGESASSFKCIVSRYDQKSFAGSETDLDYAKSAIKDAVIFHKNIGIVFH